MVLDSNQLEKICLHLLQCLWMAMLVISKWLPKSKLVSPPEWTKHNSEWIELPIAAEMMEGHPSQ